MDQPETIEETAEMVTAEGGRGIHFRADHTDEEQVKAFRFRTLACVSCSSCADHRVPLEPGGDLREVCNFDRCARFDWGLGLRQRPTAGSAVHPSRDTSEQRHH